MRLDYKNYIADAGTVNLIVNHSGRETKMYVVNLGYK